MAGVQRGAPAEQTPPPQRPEAPAAPQPKRPARTAKLSAQDQELVDCHFTPEQPPTGSGSTVLPGILGALRRLASLGMLVPVGKRYLLRLGDLLLVNSELLREIAAVTPTARTTTPGPSHPATEQEPSPSPGPPSSAPAGETHTRAGETSATTGAANSPAEMMASPPASTADALRVHGERRQSEVDPPWVVAARAEARSSAATAEGVPDDEGESDAGPQWLVSAGVRRPLAARTLINGEPIIRTTLSSVSEEESASRSGGKPKIRGPPRG